MSKIIIVTLCDKNYILKGLAMRQSLIDLNVDYFIYWLCLDDETHDALMKLKDYKIGIVKLSHLEARDPLLQAAQNNPPSKYGTQRDNYIWSLAPYFVNHILEKFILDGQFLMYVDSDIFFYHSPQVILDVIGDKRTIGIHTHRFTPTRRKLDTGIYNVGVVVFKKDDDGIRASKSWKEWVMHCDNPYYEEYGTCGDQKYLELFPILFDESVCVFDQDERISHRAPWCCDEDGKPVIFFHFSHFVHDVDKGSWSDSLHGEWKPARQEHIRPYYKAYFEVIKKVATFIK